MLTEEEFNRRWNKTTKKQKKFILRYIENGFEARQAAIYAGYSGVSITSPLFRVQRKVDDLIEYLIHKNNIMSTIVKPAWVMKAYRDIFDNTNSEITKVNILNQLSKILSMQSETKVEVNNNIPAQPVQIIFTEE